MLANTVNFWYNGIRKSKKPFVGQKELKEPNELYELCSRNPRYQPRNHNL